MTERDLRVLSEASVALGVEGNRVDLFAARAAHANASLEGRRRVSSQDLEIAVNLVLIPRSKNAPRDETSTAAIDENRNESSQAASQDREMKARQPSTNRESVPKARDSEIELAQSSKNSRTARASNRRVDGRNRDRAGDSTSGRFYRSATTPPRRGRSVSISA